MHELTGRLAEKKDQDAIEEIYSQIHIAEADGRSQTGWEAGIYPIRATAQEALAQGTLYIFETEGAPVGTAIIDHDQKPFYARIPWSCTVPNEQVLVLHTLVIDPRCARRGYGAAVLAFYEALARRCGCTWLRLDTGLGNRPARAFYRSRGFRELEAVEVRCSETSVMPLLMLEKRVEE